MESGNQQLVDLQTLINTVKDSSANGK
jgi:hypothetical protein